MTIRQKNNLLIAGVHIDLLKVSLRRRTLSVQVGEKAGTVLSVPAFSSEHDIRAFVESSKIWILKAQAKLAGRMASQKPKQFTDGELFLYRGVEYPLRIIQRATSFFDSEKAVFNISGQYSGSAREIFLKWYLRQAELHIFGRCRELAAVLPVKYSRLRLSNASRRWGACTSKGVLSFSWKLIMAPPEISDYVIIHELCHLRELNHSRSFWNLLEAFIPDYKLRKKWLEENGHNLCF